MFHPDFPAQEPYDNLPHRSFGPAVVAELHLKTAAALNLAIACGSDPVVLGQEFAEFVSSAIRGRQSTPAGVLADLYPTLQRQPVDLLKRLHNTFLTKDAGVGAVAGPA